jgi:putative nucleotidyltransferase with HDIG domain
LSHDAEISLRQRIADLEALYAANVQLSTTLDWEELLEKIIALAVQLVHADYASLFQMDEYSDTLFIVRTHNLPNDLSRTRLQIGEGIVGWVAQHREPLLFVGPLANDQYPKAFPKPHLIGSSICAPLLTPNIHNVPAKLVGVLTLSRHVDSPVLTQDNLQLIAAFCTHAGTVVQNAQTYKHARRTAIQSQHLIEVSHSLAESLDTDVVLQSILGKAVELLQCQAGSLLLVDEVTNELIFKVVSGPASEQLLDKRLPPGVGIVGTVAQTGKPLIVNDAKGDPRHYDAIDQKTSLVTQSLLCVPLISKERVMGVLEVMNKLDGTLFDESDRDLLTAFAVQSAIALGNAKLYSDLKRAFAETVRIIANAVEARDPYTAGHTNRVTAIAIEIARELGWSREQIEILEIGALVHDIGKIGMPDRILHKPEDLTQDEYNQMKQHPIIGAQMLKGIEGLRDVLPYILYHQERYDGKGYPFGLAGNAIPIEGRLLAVADTFDAMTSNRPYRDGLAAEQAIIEIQKYRGTQFDPDIVDALLVIYRKGILHKLMENHKPAPPHE